MTVKEHYDTHGKFLFLDDGDFAERQNEFLNFIKANALVPTGSGVAIDLGAGHGIQSIPLASIGFKVTAVDFNERLLTELKANAGNLNIEAVNDDIRSVKQFANRNPELIICCGDTLSHPANREEVQQLIADMSVALAGGGNLFLSFRDYSAELTGDNRIIPVRSDENRILTCILEYSSDTVRVTDLLHERTAIVWIQWVSSYNKVRITTAEIVRYVENQGMHIRLNAVANRMITIIADKA